MPTIIEALALALGALLTTADPERIRAVLSDASEVIEADPIPDKPHDEALTLFASIIYSESRYRLDVETCAVTGDKGKAIGLTQVLPGNRREFQRAEVCANRKLQLWLGWRVVRQCAARNPDNRAILRCYTSGRPHVESASSRAHWRNFKKITRKAHEHRERANAE